MPKLVKILIALAVVAAAAYILLSPSRLGRVSCEVCVEWKGAESCRTARGPTRDEAIVTARDNACAQVAFGRTDSILCGNAEPTSIRCSE